MNLANLEFLLEKFGNPGLLGKRQECHPLLYAPPPLGSVFAWIAGEKPAYTYAGDPFLEALVAFGQLLRCNYNVSVFKIFLSEKKSPDPIRLNGIRSKS